MELTFPDFQFQKTMVYRSLRHLVWCSWLYNGGPIGVRVTEASSTGLKKT